MHAYLLTGNDPDMTDSAARRAASLMLYSGDDTERLKIDPDYMEYSGNISISEFRDVIRPEIYRETYSKAGRIVVFRQANLLSQMVQNAMLKVLARKYAFHTYGQRVWDPAHDPFALHDNPLQHTFFGRSRKNTDRARRRRFRSKEIRRDER